MARALGGLLALALVASGAHADPSSLDLWPLVVRDARPVAGLQTTRLGGPFFESWRVTPDEAVGASSEMPSETGWTLRPLLSRLETEGERSLEFLFPLGELERDEEGTRLRLSPLLDHTWRAPRSDPASEERSSWSFLLAFGGRTREGERYGGVFPFAGVAKERFGLERLEFLLFPLFGRSRDESGHTRIHVLWPFFTWGSGGGRRSLRLWPFYGHDVREGEYDRRFVLWPFVHWRTERPGEPEERRVRLVLPFYGESVRRHARARFVLGPLYVRSENDVTGATSTDLPWPFVHVASRPPSEHHPGSRELRVEPFFRRSRTGDRVRTGALFGAVERSHGRDGDLEFDSFRAMFVTRFGFVRDRASGAELHRRDVWPFFHYREAVDAEGVRRGKLRAPWPLPFSGEGWERGVLGLVTGYERRWRGEETRSDWLWGLARTRRAPEYRLDAFSWIYRHETWDETSSTRVFGVRVD